MASLIVVRGPRVGLDYPLRESRQRLGRDSHCEIHLDDTEASRNHAEVAYMDGKYRIKDLGSSNGTFVNGDRVDEHVLNAGDRIQIGRQLLVFRPAHRSQLLTDHHVDILPRSTIDSSQIIGRAVLASQLSEETGDWRDATRPPLDREHLQAKSHWEVMYRTALAVSRTLDIDQLLQQILELIFQWVKCDRGCIMLTDSETGELRPSCRRNRHASAKGNRMAISRTILDYVVKHEEGVLTSDAGDDGRWNTSASIAEGGIREAMCVPMRGRYGSVGVIYIDTNLAPHLRSNDPGRIFQEEHLKLLIAIGHQAALAIEDTHYYQSMVHAERLATMGQTIATLSHHIKNIVQGLKGGGYLIDQGLKSGDLEPIANGWRICERNQERIETLVLDMLAMSKDRKPNRQPIDLRTIVEDVVELSRTIVRDRKVNVAWAPPVVFPSMMLDAEAIHRALLNLVCNAIDACHDREDGQVSVELHSERSHASIRITDNGIGIAEADLHRIFSLFESSKGIRGTGLGLPVSLKIAREHGGTIDVRSTVGEGTVFELQLPWQSNQASATNDNRPTMAM